MRYHKACSRDNVWRVGNAVLIHFLLAKGRVMRGNKIRQWLIVVACWLGCGAFAAAESPSEVLQHYPADTEGTPTPVVEALKKATLPPGFQMTCFANEPDVLQPIAINVDDRGRLWVAECFSYPQWAATGRDRLTILEDTNGDGKFDKRKVFWAEGNYLTGFQLGYGGVFVCSARISCLSLIKTATIFPMVRRKKSSLVGVLLASITW